MAELKANYLLPFIVFENRGVDEYCRESCEKFTRDGNEFSRKQIFRERAYSSVNDRIDTLRSRRSLSSIPHLFFNQRTYMSGLRI